MKIISGSSNPNLAKRISKTIGFELLDHKLHHLLAGSIYHEMLTKIYKELTILGFLSFGVFMALNYSFNYWEVNRPLNSRFLRVKVHSFIF